MQFFEQPEVRFDLQYILDAFYELGTERQSGMGVGPIPASRIRSHATDILALEPDSDAADRFFDLIRRMDGEYVNANNKSADPKKPEGSTVAVDDAVGVTRLFDALESRKKNESAADEGKERK